MRPPRRYAAAFGIVLVSTGLSEILFRLTESTRLSLVFLCGVLLAAYLLGSGPAYFAALLAFTIYNFYLVDPRFTITMGTTDDLLTLVVFLAVAMLTGNLTGRVRDEAAKARARAATTAALFDATRDFSASGDEQIIRQRLAAHLAAAAKGPAFVRADGAMAAAPAGLAISADLSRAADTAAVAGEAGEIETRRVEGWSLRPLLADGAPLGGAGWRPASAWAAQPDQQPLFDILVDVGAAAIARARLAAARADAEARVRTDQLRDALLSSISHDLRTPLAAIVASASSLHEFGDTFDEPTRRDLAGTIQEAADRLNLYVGNLLNMTKLEAGALAVQTAPFSIGEVAERVARRHGLAGTHPLSVAVAPGLPEALGDPVLFEQALANVVENATRYTPRGGGVELACEAADGWLTVRVRDHGPGVAPADLECIFEKFFRAAGVRTSGAGLGLSITRGLVEGMGGRVTARNTDDGEESGLIVSLALPLAA
jgi:two-component system sensor histidine kinase KdpD